MIDELLGSAFARPHYSEAQLNALRHPFAQQQFSMDEAYRQQAMGLSGSLGGLFGVGFLGGDRRGIMNIPNIEPKKPSSWVSKVTAKPGYIITYQRIEFGVVKSCTVRKKVLADYTFGKRVILRLERVIRWFADETGKGKSK